MLSLFTPNYYIHRYDALRVEYLKEHGIELLLCDIDNTLVPHDVADADEEAKAFLKKILDANIQIVFVSNNVEERVARFAKCFDLPYYHFALKPLPKTYLKVLKDFGYKGKNKKKVAVLGDQMMTDVLGSKLCGLHVILTNQVVERDLTCTKWNRKLENIMFYLLKKFKRLERGVYDE